MTNQIITALITSGSTLLLGAFTVWNSNRIISYKIDALEKKQDKHNGLIERMVCVEQSTKSAHHRLDHMEEMEKKNEH